jgi:hypothetical protein
MSTNSGPQFPMRNTPTNKSMLGQGELGFETAVMAASNSCHSHLDNHNERGVP